MQEFSGKIAVVTGGGSGMGRELVIALANDGCDVAMCDLSTTHMAETRKLALADAPDGTTITSHECDVSSETSVLKFRDAVLAEHNTQHINLLFNNAGIGGGGSMIAQSQEEWDRTFGVCWYGVYYCCRAFLNALVTSSEAHIVNTSSVNGFWAWLGPGSAHTAYSAAKFTVKGFSEALITDLKLNAPHVNVSVVMPGHIGTSIAINTRSALGHGHVADASAEEVAAVRARLVARGLPVGNESDDQIRERMAEQGRNFRDNAPTTAGEAANIILTGVRENRWRILVGDDAKALDQLVRSAPEDAYDASFMTSIQSQGHLNRLGARDQKD